MNRNMKFIPPELVDMIADYHDYDKYCKPTHKVLLKSILDDIKAMSEIMPTINPVLVWQCWGPGVKYLENMVGLYDEYEADMAQFDYEGGGWYN